MDSGALVSFPIDITLPRLETDMPSLGLWARLVGQAQNTLVAIPTFRIEPQVNTDNSITLLTIAGADGTGETIHTVFTGSLKVYEITRLTQTPGYRMLLFLTPKILDEKSRVEEDGGQSVTVTP